MEFSVTHGNIILGYVHTAPFSFLSNVLDENAARSHCSVFKCIRYENDKRSHCSSKTVLPMRFSKNAFVNGCQKDANCDSECHCNQ